MMVARRTAVTAVLHITCRPNHQYQYIEFIVSGERTQITQNMHKPHFNTEQWKTLISITRSSLSRGCVQSGALLSPGHPLDSCPNFAEFDTGPTLLDGQVQRLLGDSAQALGCIADLAAEEHAGCVLRAEAWVGLGMWVWVGVEVGIEEVVGEQEENQGCCIDAALVMKYIAYCLCRSCLSTSIQKAQLAQQSITVQTYRRQGLATTALLLAREARQTNR